MDENSDYGTLVGTVAAADAEIEQYTDPIERRAIQLSAQVITQADVIIAMKDPATPWPDLTLPNTDKPLTPHLWVTNKIDDPTPSPPPQSGHKPDSPLPISAKHNHHLDHLQTLILTTLGLQEIAPNEPWAFSPTLHQAMKHGHPDHLATYIETTPATA